ncbi:sulfatase [Pontiella agarivorans]|uniref:Sulfatase n=1 Tax=Pontiella agarivorans TaxID=3038953 RepID=A0ABU5MTB1_9BACT|nr:sulfatase [Pontiella agarivorans]MDZ8117454.1 sulfatase [Pontiella agarivorans]
MKKILAAALLIAGAAQAREPNVLLLCIDDLRPELNSFGADYIESPNIDALAAAGRAFHHHYVNAPSCGPSRCTLLTGRYGAPANDALFRRAEQVAENPETVPPSMPEWFRQHGYTTVSVGKVSHHPGGLGGPDWNDESKIEVPGAWDARLMPCGEWQHPRGAMHGLAHGEIREKAKEMDIFQSAKGPDTIYPDGLIAEEGIHQLETLAGADKPFFLAIGLIKPHLPFGAPAKYMTPYKNITLPPIPHPAKPAGKTTWHGSGEFMKYNRWKKNPNSDPDFADAVRRHYAACVTYADKHVGDIMAALKATGADKNTVIVLWGDHGWHLGEHAIWGKHSLFEESLRSPLIISFPELGDPGRSSEAVVSTLDIFPTLCDLTGIESPDFANGRSLLPILENPDASGHGAISYKSNARTLRTATHRIIVHNNGFVELYDHTAPEKETLNIASQHPDLVEQLKKQMAAMKE